MEILEFPPLAWKPTLLVPIADVQYGAQGCWTDGFKRWLAAVFEEAEKRELALYFIGGGDYVDMLSPSNRKKWAAAELYDIAVDSMAEMAERHIEGFLELVKGTEDKWIGMLEGHHYFEFEDGTTSDTRLCAALGAPFLGDCAQIHLHFGGGPYKMLGKRATVRIWTHHGVGSGSPVAKLEHQAGKCDADLLLMGHTPTIETKKIPYLYTTEESPPDFRCRNRHLVGTGGWLRGYTKGSRRSGRAQGNYVEQGMLLPAPLGGVRIYLTPETVGREHSVQIEVLT